MIRISFNKLGAILAVSIASAFFGIPEASAVPAYRGLLKATQPDGTTLEYRKIGDEHNHIILSSDNRLLTWNDGKLEYASVTSNGIIQSTGILAHEAGSRNLYETNLSTVITDGGQEIFTLRSKQARAKAPDTLPGRFTSSFPPTGDANVLVILVQYKDVKFNLTDPYTYFNNMLNLEGFSEWGGTGCAKEYFKENSNDLFRPHFDVYGPVTLPETMAYYGGNDIYGNDSNASKMVVHAAEILDPTVDFSRYDMDNDGYIDNVFVIFAGQGEATYGSPDTVWPHSYDLLKDWEFVTVDNKMLNHYACCNEWLNDRPDGVGTFIHEFSHVIGLPDLYATKGRINATPSSWSVLDYGPYNNGGCTPPNYSVFERSAMGWITPKEIEGTMNLTLEELSSSNDAAIIRLSDTKDEYFLLENRQQTGWDKYLPGHGMIVWHVDYLRSVWEMNEVNNDATHQRVDIIEANGKADMADWKVMAQYPFPGPLGKTELGFTTTPQLATWAGTSTGIELTDIEELSDGVIMARVNGGVFTLSKPVITGFEDLNDKFRIIWKEVEDASSYELKVMTYSDGISGSDENAMGNGSKLTLPEGWTSETTKVYTTSGNYGKAAPSYKMEKDADWMQSPEYPADITYMSFWMKGTQTTSSTLDVLGLINGEWKVIQTFTPQNNKAETCVVEMPAGVRQIKIQYNMVKGRVALDDIEIVYGYPSEIIDGYDAHKVDGTDHIVDCNGIAARSFLCQVRALSMDDKSQWSEPFRVNIAEAGISNVVTQSSNLYVHGFEAINSAGKEVNIFDLTGRKIASGKGNARIPSKGLYIIVSGGEVLKVSK